MIDRINSIKKESYLKVLHELCFDCELSVSELSEKCSISTFTLAKILDWLSEKRIVSVTYSNAEKGERRHRLYYIRTSYNSVAADISSSVFKFYVCKPGRSPRRLLSCPYRTELSFEQNIDYFKKNIGYVSTTISKNKNAGTLILLPGTPDKEHKYITDPIYPDTKDIKLTHIINELTFSQNACYDESCHFRAKAIQSLGISSNELALIIFLDNKRFSSCIVSGDTEHIKIGKLGEKRDEFGNTFLSEIKYLQDPGKITSIFAKEIIDLYSAIGFSHVYITGDYIPHLNILSEMILAEVNQSIPDIQTIKPLTSEKMLEIKLKTLIYEHLADIILDK